MTRYFLDTEFIDDGKTIDLISIGIVCEDSREYYAQSTEFYAGHASDWVKEQVLSHLSLCPHLNRGDGDILAQIQHQQSSHGFFGGQCYEVGLTRHEKDCPWRTRRELAKDIREFFKSPDSFEVWGWCAGYDFVALCQIFGTMMDLPNGFPHYIKDIQYVLDERGIADEDLPPNAWAAHNALTDAKYIWQLWGFLHQ